jgi:hypothetical protein
VGVLNGDCPVRFLLTTCRLLLDLLNCVGMTWIGLNLFSACFKEWSGILVCISAHNDSVNLRTWGIMCHE